MRRILALATVIVLVCLLSIGVSAETGASGVSVYATVSSDGSCQATVTATLHLEQAVQELTFPLPLEAESVTLNGSRVHTTKTGTARLVDLSGIAGSIAGDFSVTMTYTLDNVVQTNEDGILELQMPLLSGFSYPVQTLDFSVTLPAQVETQPAFSSGYHQANIEKDLTYQVSGAAVTGSASKALKDHETLTMSLLVSGEMFPQTGPELPDLNVTNILMAVSAVLALAYWLLFLRNRPFFRTSATGSPEGYTAGQLGSVLSLQGADLTMMVFTWAQLGYLRIYMDRHGRVTLRKRMDMGNERSSFEQRCFKNLFIKRTTVDTSGTYYAAQWQKTAKMPPNIQPLLRPKSGSQRIFRGLAALIGLFGGAALGITLGMGAAVQWLWAILLAVLGAVSSWHIQRWAQCLFLLDKRKLWNALLLCGGWLALSLLAGNGGIGICVILAQLLAGLMSAFGGRRTDVGRQAVNQILGLRRYLRRISRTELQRICESDPEYFFKLAPDALALGMDKAFAKHFGSLRLPECPYLSLGKETAWTAAQWSAYMRGVVRAMDEHRKKMRREKFLGFFQGLIR